MQELDLKRGQRHIMMQKMSRSKLWGIVNWYRVPRMDHVLLMVRMTFAIPTPSVSLEISILRMPLVSKGDRGVSSSEYYCHIKPSCAGLLSSSTRFGEIGGNLYKSQTNKYSLTYEYSQTTISAVVHLGVGTVIPIIILVYLRRG